MISLMRCGLPALALAALPLLATPAASAGTPLPVEEQPFTSYAPAQTPDGAPGAARLSLGLFEAIDRLPVAEEHREGYKRTLYKHWNRGLNATDGCDTRREVILSEAVNAPEVAVGCKLTGGSWRSAYDGLVVSDAGRLDVDHFVPLAEVYDSEQTPWSAERREAYANDQGSADTLIAVSAASNRSKSDKDPAQWMPTDGAYQCTYAATWVATKLRWDLAVDDAERQALLGTAEDCTGTTVTYEPAP
ncbi:HNH endonuclease family protein [Streptomyces sp. NPDC048210]|uniref:HNH endonuclease family protein n=1 Tax=unclassified Streptomyces TaxID=2593676 RepID=UPI002E7643E5|nr:HNH endonuclease family protein [Streptomyces sp. JV181]MEE1774844.1 HNH endonuclease family protein [Streptomyces sp. JV181]